MRKRAVMRISALIIALLMLLAFTACGSSKNTNDKVKATDTISRQTTSPLISGTKTAQPTTTVSLAPTATPTATLKPTASPKSSLLSGIGYVNEANVNLRTSASASSASLAKMARNTKVDVIKRDAGNGWSQISYEGKNGYIASQYLTMVGDEDILDNKVMGVITEAGVNIRSEAKTSSESLGTLTKNAEVTVIKKDAGGGWSLILYGGRLVYVAAKYIKLK